MCLQEVYIETHKLQVWNTWTTIMKHIDSKSKTHEMKICITHMWQYNEKFDKELNNVVTFKWNYIVVVCWLFKLEGETSKIWKKYLSKNIGCNILVVKLKK
jgi:hypothetical protein